MSTKSAAIAAFALAAIAGFVIGGVTPGFGLFADDERAAPASDHSPKVNAPPESERPPTDDLLHERAEVEKMRNAFMDEIPDLKAQLDPLKEELAEARKGAAARPPDGTKPK